MKTTCHMHAPCAESSVPPPAPSVPRFACANVSRLCAWAAGNLCRFDPRLIQFLNLFLRAETLACDISTQWQPQT